MLCRLLNGFVVMQLLANAVSGFVVVACGDDDGQSLNVLRLNHLEGSKFPDVHTRFVLYCVPVNTVVYQKGIILQKRTGSAQRRRLADVQLLDVLERIPACECAL